MNLNLALNHHHLGSYRFADLQFRATVSGSVSRLDCQYSHLKTFWTVWLVSYSQVSHSFWSVRIFFTQVWAKIASLLHHNKLTNLEATQVQNSYLYLKSFLRSSVCTILIPYYIKTVWEMVKSPHVTVLPKSVGKRSSEKHEADTQHTCLQSIWFHSSWNIATAAVHYRTSALDVTCNRTSWWCFVVSLWPHRIKPKEPKLGTVDDEKVPTLCFPNRRESTTGAGRARQALPSLFSLKIWLVPRQDPGISILMLIY